MTRTLKSFDAYPSHHSGARRPHHTRFEYRKTSTADMYGQQAGCWSGATTRLYGKLVGTGHAIINGLPRLERGTWHPPRYPHKESDPCRRWAFRPAPSLSILGLRAFSTVLSNVLTRLTDFGITGLILACLFDIGLQWSTIVHCTTN